MNIPFHSPSGQEMAIRISTCTAKNILARVKDFKADQSRRTIKRCLQPPSEQESRETPGKHSCVQPLRASSLATVTTQSFANGGQCTHVLVKVFHTARNPTAGGAPSTVNKRRRGVANVCSGFQSCLPFGTITPELALVANAVTDAHVFVVRVRFLVGAIDGIQLVGTAATWPQCRVQRGVGDAGELLSLAAFPVRLPRPLIDDELLPLHVIGVKPLDHGF